MIERRLNNEGRILVVIRKQLLLIPLMENVTERKATKGLTLPFICCAALYFTNSYCFAIFAYAKNVYSPLLVSKTTCFYNLYSFPSDNQRATQRLFVKDITLSHLITLEIKTATLPSCQRGFRYLSAFVLDLYASGMSCTNHVQIWWKMFCRERCD